MTKKAPDIIDQPCVSKARSILKALSHEDRQLAIRVRQMALSCLADVDVEDVAAGVYAELGAHEVEEVWARADASYRLGCVDPSEVAYEMLEEVLNPLLFELEKDRQLGMNAQANQVCTGLLPGLYTFEHESRNEFKEWAIDVAGEWLGEVVLAWKDLVSPCLLTVTWQLWQWRGTACVSPAGSGLNKVPRQEVEG